MKRYIPVSRVEGTASRQAHCDLPEGHLRARDEQGGLLRARRVLPPPSPADGLDRFHRAAAAACVRPVEAGVAGDQSVVGAAKCWRTPIAGSATGASKPAWRGSLETRTATSCCSSTQAAVTCTATSGTSRSRRATTWCCPEARCGASTARPRSRRCWSRRPTRATCFRTRAWSAITRSSIRRCSTRRRSMPRSWPSRATRRPGRSRSSDATRCR